MKIEKSNFSEWYNTITKEAGLCDLRYNIKGFIVILPWAMETINKIYEFYEKELARTKHKAAFFPSLIPESAFEKEKEHVAGFTPEVLWVTEAGNKKLNERYAMKPTGETSIYPMYALWVKGIKNLPIKIYQRNWVWRYETKATKPFIRGREFLWIEEHDVFATPEEAEAQIREDMEMAINVIWKKLGVPFLFLKRPQWDKFAGAVNTYAADTIMPDGRVLQIATTHNLGQNFSKAFEIKYMDEKGEMQYCWQTTYGPGINRIYAAMFSIHGDERGLVLPFEVAPVQIIIVPIVKKGLEEQLKKYAKEILQKLNRKFRIEIDLSEHTPGYKFNFWEMKGVPIRIEIGEKELNEKKITIAPRLGNKVSAKLEEAEEKIEEEAKKLNHYLKERAKKEFEKSLSSAEKLEDAERKVQKGMVKVPFCSDQNDGVECAEKLKEKNIHVRGSLVMDFEGNEREEKVEGKCIVCGKEAKLYVYIGRQY